MNKKYLILILLGMSSFVARGNEVEPIETLDEGEGYAILRVLVNVDKNDSENLSTGIRGIMINGRQTYTFKDIYQGQNIEVIKLPEGDYSWSTIMTPHRSYFNLNDLNFNFSVVAGKINYGGDLLINRRENLPTKLDYINRSSFARRTIIANYPELLKSHEMIYTGLSRDVYFKFVNELESGESE